MNRYSTVFADCTKQTIRNCAEVCLSLIFDVELFILGYSGFVISYKKTVNALQTEGLNCIDDFLDFRVVAQFSLPIGQELGGFFNKITEPNLDALFL